MNICPRGSLQSKESSRQWTYHFSAKCASRIVETKTLYRLTFICLIRPRLNTMVNNTSNLSSTSADLRHSSRTTSACCESSTDFERVQEFLVNESTILNQVKHSPDSLFSPACLPRTQAQLHNRKHRNYGEQHWNLGPKKKAQQQRCPRSLK